MTYVCVCSVQDGADSEMSYMKWIAGTETFNINKSLGTLSLVDQSMR